MKEILEIINEIETWYINMEKTMYIYKRGQRRTEQIEIEKKVIRLCNKCKEKLKNLT